MTIPLDAVDAHFTLAGTFEQQSFKKHGGRE
jgi:hypothetical protein